MSSLYLVMPAYNEEANIEKTVAQWHPVAERISKDMDCRLVIANDGSKDATYAKLQELQKQYPLLVPIDKKNSGHGATVLFLYRYAIEQGAEFIFQTDSDGQTDPEEFWQMYENRDKYDFQIGNRNHREDGASRVFVTKLPPDERQSAKAYIGSYTAGFLPMQCSHISHCREVARALQVVSHHIQTAPGWSKLHQYEAYI